jgi:hypothetical protein
VLIGGNELRVVAAVDALRVVHPGVPDHVAQERLDLGPEGRSLDRHGFRMDDDEFVDPLGARIRGEVLVDEGVALL